MYETEEGRLLADVHDAAAALGEARVRLHETVLAATRAGIRQRSIVEASGYTREHVRRLARADGIPARRADRTVHLVRDYPPPSVRFTDGPLAGQVLVLEWERFSPRAPRMKAGMCTGL